MALTPPPTLPTSSDTPTVFDARMYALIGWYAVMTSEHGSLQSDVAAKQAQTAIDAATAAAAASTAVAAAGATQWVAGTYASGACVWSPSSFQTFRKAGAGASAVDPATNSTGWVLISSTPQILNQVAGTSVAGVFGNDYALSNIAASTVVLPATPTAGAAPIRAIICNGLMTNSFSRNGSLIHGKAEDFYFDQPERTYSAVYINSTVGWRIS